MVTSQDMEGALCARMHSLLQILDPGLVDADRIRMLRLAGDRACVAADAAPIVDDESIGDFIAGIHVLNLTAGTVPGHDSPRVDLDFFRPQVGVAARTSAPPCEGPVGAALPRQIGREQGACRLNRIFLGTEHDALECAAAKMLESAPPSAGGGPFDLRELIVLIPGRQAGRRLRRVLVQQADALGRGLLPPRISTPGHLESLVCAPDQPFATVLEERIAWIRALRSCPPDLLATIGLESAALGASALLALARLLSRLCSDLRREGVTLGQAAETTARNDPNAALRLRTVERIEAIRSARLRELGLTDTGEFCSNPAKQDQRIILLGILEIPARMRQWLQQNCQAQAWIDADEARQHRYDDFGCPIPDQWESLDGPAPAEMIVADDPRSLTAALLQQIHQHSSDSAEAQITIGLLDQKLSPWLLEGFRRSGIPLHVAAGTPHAESSCGRLLADLHSAVESLSRRSVAALARHPAIHIRLPGLTLKGGGELEPIESIDRWSSKRQPVQASDPLAPPAVEFIRKAIEPLRTDAGNCSDRVQQLLQCFLDLVGSGDTGQPSLPASGLDGLISAVEKLSRIGDRDEDPLSGSDAIALIIDLLEESAIPDRHQNSCIGLLGWLELSFDSADVLLLTGATEGQLSPAPSGDPLLPHGVRQELGLPGTREEGARDSHLLHALLDGRRKTIVALCARSGEGDPLLPSRLLLQGTDGLDRLAHFLDRKKRYRYHLGEPEQVANSPDSLGAPRSVLLPPPETIAVTSFSDYIEDPVLFQMNRVLKLRDCHDRDRQLNPADFGSLIHKVLEYYGKDVDLRALTDEDQIREALHQLLDRYRSRKIADPARAAVMVQLEQARARLDAWASLQAHQRAQGWRLVAAEIDLDSTRCRIEVPEGEMGLSGRIDRIDYNEQTQRWRLLDYKTGDSGKTPEQDHRKGPKNSKSWVKLQLPLYLQFAHQLEIDGLTRQSEMETGFCLLPASPEETRIEIATWSPEDLEVARELSEATVSEILSGTEQPLSVLKTPWQRAFAGTTVESASRLDGIADKDDEEGSR